MRSFFFFSSRRRHTRFDCDWSSDVCSSDLVDLQYVLPQGRAVTTFLGIGLGAHVRHGSGPAIEGTFVQDALNSITAGLNGTIGTEGGAKSWRFVFEGRGGPSSGGSTLAVRSGGAYRLAGRTGQARGA